MAVAEKQELNAREITDRNQQGKIELRGQDPRKTFYMALSVGNLDGSIDEPHAEGCEAITDTEEEAIEAAKDVNDSYPTLEVWVYKCVPVAKIWRGKTRVDKFTPK